MTLCRQVLAFGRPPRDTEIASLAAQPQATTSKPKKSKASKKKKKTKRPVTLEQREDALSDEWDGNSSDETISDLSDTLNSDHPYRLWPDGPAAEWPEDQPRERWPLDLQFLPIYETRVTLPRTNVSTILSVCLASN